MFERKLYRSKQTVLNDTNKRKTVAQFQILVEAELPSIRSFVIIRPFDN